MYSARPWLVAGVAIALLAIFSCSSSEPVLPGEEKRNRGVADPFPAELLGHRLFKVFRSDNRLGFAFRDEARQIFAPRIWTGRESVPRGRGQDRTIEFEREQSRGLSARIPAVGFNTRYQGVLRFKLQLRGLKIHELLVPVVEQEFRGSKESNEPFVASLLSAGEVIIQAEIKEGNSFRVGTEQDITGIFQGQVEYSRNHKGVVAAKNVFLGYALTKPTARDLARSSGGKEIRRLAVFELQDHTGDRAFSFLRRTMRQKLEQVFSGLPQFEVVSGGNAARRDQAKYHLRGSYEKIDDGLLNVSLNLTNTYENNKLVTPPLARGVQFKDTAELYRLQEDIVHEFVKSMGIKLSDSEKKQVSQEIRQTKKLDTLRLYQQARGTYRKGDYAAARAQAETILKEDPDYFDALTLYVRVLERLSRISEANEQVQRLVVLAKQKKDPSWQATALTLQGTLLGAAAKHAESLPAYQKALTLTKARFGNDHVKTAWSSYYVGLAHYRLGVVRRSDADFQQATKHLNVAEQILVRRFGPDSSNLLPVISLLGHVAGAGKSAWGETALEYYSRCVRIAEKSYGRQHPETGTAYVNFGKSLAAQRQYRRGLAYLARALRIRKKAFKGNSAHVADAKSKIAVVYFRMNDYRSSRYFFEDAYRTLQRLYGQSHADARNFAAWIGDTHFKEGDDAKATEWWTKGGLSAEVMQRKRRVLAKDRWVKDQGGSIPQEAYAAGKESDGKSLYVCRVFHEGALSIGKIRPGFGACNFSNDGKELKKTQYHVLALSKGRWESASGGNVPDRGYIAGYEKANPLYVCRVNYQGGVQLGRVRPKLKGCLFGYGGQEVSQPTYEVLLGN